MDDDDLEAALNAAEDDIAAETRAILDEVAEEFAAHLAEATELVAARFSVSRISRMWADRIPRFVRRLLGVAETAAGTAADSVDAELPDGWDDLPGRYDDGTLPEGIGAYVDTTEHLMRAVGERLSARAVDELAAGLDAGEDIDALRARLRAVFNTEAGAQLGPGREGNIAQTEAARAWNTATLSAARELAGPDRPLVKQWRMTNSPQGDDRVRADHRAADGQLRLLDEPFTVGGVRMQHPGDPSAPPEQVCRCRCILVLERAPDPTAALETQARLGGESSNVRSSVRMVSLTAADSEHTGAMIALIPTEEDAVRLALDDGEPAGELHLTLFYLGKAEDWDEDQRAELIRGMRAQAQEHGLADDHVHARAFGANMWNADRDEPCWVWAVGDDPDRPQHAPTMEAARYAATYALEDTHGPGIPAQHTPWAPHACAVYTAEDWPLEPMAERTGPLTFDRIRVAFGGEYTDIPLGPQQAHDEVTASEAPVGGADVQHHGGYDAARNEGPGTAGSGCAHCGCGGAQAERMPPVGADALEVSGVRDDHGRREGTPGNGDAGDRRGEVRTADRAGGARTPHVPHAAVRRGVSPQPDPGAGARGVPRPGADTDRVLRAQAPVHPAGREGLGGVPGLPAGGHAPLGSEQPGQAPGEAVQRGDAGQEAGIGQGPQEHAGVPGAGGGVAARTASAAEGGRSERTQELRPAGGLDEEAPMPQDTTAAAVDTARLTRTWSTPGTAALAFENQQTGDGRVFTPGALAWDRDPMPLQYADEMLMGHQGAELAGAIQAVIRDGDRITAAGVLYASRPAGADAIQLLDEEAPLGVSVDLDDVDLEFVDKTLSPEDADWLFASARLPSASLMSMEDGSVMLSAATAAEWTASDGALSRNRYDLQLISGPGGILTASSIRHAFTGTGILTAAAGDPDNPDEGLVLHAQRSGDFLMRITRARLRGATLVAMPAFKDARIILDPPSDTTAAVQPVITAAGETRERVITYVCSSPAAVGARDTSSALSIAMSTARGHLNAAAKDGRIIRLAPGLYCGPSTLPEGTAADTADQGSAELLASAWQELQKLPPMPASWFAEPTAEELPPGSGGVHYNDGRVYGWVAQAGEPHAGMPGRNLTIESLGDIDLSHFLRKRFLLDDGSEIRAGAFTMNVGHHRDGAECETSACQFDDSRTVAGVVTVGMNERGMWFSGAGAPWLSEWDRTVFTACQPSYHMRQSPDGRWQLRAVLSVPVPGHSSPLLAAAVERSNLALAASAALITDTPDTEPGQHPDIAPGLEDSPTLNASDLPGQRPDTASGHLPDAPELAEALVAAMVDNHEFLDRLAEAQNRRATERAAMEAEIERLAAQLDPAITDLATDALAGATLKGHH